MRVALSTHGCRLNQAETDAMEARLRQAGHEVVGPAGAEWIVLNTCTITHQADADARQTIRRLKRANPAAKVLVTGCYAQADPQGVAGLEGVDVVLGNGDKDRLLETLADRAAEAPSGAWVSVSALRRRHTLTALSPARAPHRSRALLKIQDGCNYRCSFCIVPRVRGPSRSETIERLRSQCARLVAEGAPEIVLTGIHLGTWGRDLRPRRRLAALVEALLPVLGRARLRLGSLDPHEVDDELIALMAAHPERICRHLHLPVQSGDPQVLRRMRRGHTAGDFVALCEKVLAEVPGVALGTDVIVGFPGESEEAFARTEAMLEGLPLAYHHVFTYSPRKGTAAMTMPDHVDPATKQRRNKRLQSLSDRQARAFARALGGRIVDAVIEPRGRDRAIATTDNYVRLRVDGIPSKLRRRAHVRVHEDGRRCTIVS